MPLKTCCVPSCNNDSGNSPEKLFLTIPKNFKRADNWAKAINARGRLRSGGIYCCEDHFNLPEDSMNWSYYKLIGKSLHLKPEVVPHLYIESPPKEKLVPQLSEDAKIIKSQNLQKRPSSTPITHGEKQLMRYSSVESNDEATSEPVFYEIVGMQLTSTGPKSDCIPPPTGSVIAAIDVGTPCASTSNCDSSGKYSKVIIDDKSEEGVVSEPLYLEVISVQLTSSGIAHELNKSTNLTRKFKAILPATSTPKPVSSKEISNTIAKKEQELGLNNYEFKSRGLLRSLLLESSDMAIKNEQLDLEEDYRDAVVSDPLLLDVGIDLNQPDNKNYSITPLSNLEAAPNVDIPCTLEECWETAVKKEDEAFSTQDSKNHVFLENVSMKLVPSETKTKGTLTSNNLEPCSVGVQVQPLVRNVDVQVNLKKTVRHVGTNISTTNTRTVGTNTNDTLFKLLQAPSKVNIATNTC